MRFLNGATPMAAVVIHRWHQAYKGLRGIASALRDSSVSVGIVGRGVWHGVSASGGSVDCGGKHAVLRSHKAFRGRADRYRELR
jgi:hypothetical protein